MRKETIYKHGALLSAATGSVPCVADRWPALRLLPGLCLIKVNGMNASRERRPLLPLPLLFVLCRVATLSHSLGQSGGTRCYGDKAHTLLKFRVAFRPNIIKPANTDMTVRATR
jgi:hypothetical protein